MANLDLYKRKKRAVPSSGGSGRESEQPRFRGLAHEPYEAERAAEKEYRGEYMRSEGEAFLGRMAQPTMKPGQYSGDDYDKALNETGRRNRLLRDENM